MSVQNFPISARTFQLLVFSNCPFQPHVSQIYGSREKINEPQKDSNGTLYKGAAYELADLAGDDLAFVDGVFDDCAADDYQGHGLELEVYKFDYDGRSWNGSYFY